MTVRRKWHIKDKFVLVWVIFKLCQKKGIPEIKMVSVFNVCLFFVQLI